MPTEIELKYLVPDEETFQALLRVDALAGLRADPPQVKRDHDRYLDTADRRFLGCGYVCRLRERSGQGGYLITLKSTQPADAALHTREEVEVALPADDADAFDPAAWPAGEAQRLALAIADGRPLTLLFELWQERHVRTLWADGGKERPAVELSLDRVWLVSRNEPPLLAVEAELMAGGRPEHLAALAEALTARWPLQPDTHTKFEHGLARLEPAAA
ncbi:MAG: CYTH domain-containing protein [Caldilineales bacterium]|nr:CYTH domain-containing protein [Caldilineales bacterium]MDW8316566.1 CYTH domain-containing protein [Anaerolineae bacterium]